MANAGKNTNGSQFFLTFIPCDWLDGKHVVFGEVVDGFDILEELEAVSSSTGATTKKVKIEDSGEL